MAGNEMDIGYQWIQATLIADSTLAGYIPGNVWRAEAPDGTAAPYVTITYRDNQSHDEIVFGGARAYSDLYFEVCAAGPAIDLQNITSAAARIDELITITQSTAITGGTIQACYRSAPVGTDPLVSGEIWTNSGGTYRMMIKAS